MTGVWKKRVRDCGGVAPDELIVNVVVDVDLKDERDFKSTPRGGACDNFLGHWNKTKNQMPTKSLVDS